MAEIHSQQSSNRDNHSRFGPALFKFVTMAASSGVKLFKLDRYNGQLEVMGQTRYYILHVPENLDPSTPVPLVVTFHGFAEWPMHVMRTSRWNKLADKYGFIVVYPSGTGMPKRWHTGGSGTWHDDATPDICFVTDLIADLQSRYNIDSRRIYLNGFSNGGGISHMLAFQMADRIAAFGSVSGALLYPTQGQSLTRPVPFIAFHGTADRIVPFYGGSTDHFRFSFPPVTNWVRNWADLNGCDPTPKTIFNSPHVTGQQYDGSSPDEEVVFYTISGGGHAWPGGVPLPRWIAGRTTQEIDATELMWQFFSRHPLPG